MQKYLQILHLEYYDGHKVGRDEGGSHILPLYFLLNLWPLPPFSSQSPHHSMGYPASRLPHGPVPDAFDGRYCLLHCLSGGGKSQLAGFELQFLNIYIF